MTADLQPYPAMKDSGVPWLGEVPEHWEVRRLKQAFRRIVGGSTPSSAEATYWDGDVVWVTPADVSKAERLSKSQRGITRKGLNSCSSELVPPGSLVVTSRAPVGNVAIAEVELCTNQGCKALIVTDEVVNPMFGFHVFKTLKLELQSLATGTTFSEISTTRLGTVPMALPPLPEQAAIVRFLDHADRRIRRYIRAKQKLINLLEEQKQAIIHRAVTRGLDPNVRLKPSGVEWLGDVPEHWEVLPLKRWVSTEITDGPHETPEWLDDGVPFISAEAMVGGRLDFSRRRGFISRELHEAYCRKCRPQRDDIFMCKSGATTGKLAIVETDDEFSVWSPLALIRVSPERVLSRLLFVVLQSRYVQRQVQDTWSYGTQPNLSMAAMERVVVVLPPLNEQIALLAHLDQMTKTPSKAIDRAQREISFLREYRTRLIADVVTGKLDVREAAAQLPDKAEEPEPLDEADAMTDAEEGMADDDLDAAPEQAEA